MRPTGSSRRTASESGSPTTSVCRKSPSAAGSRRRSTRWPGQGPPPVGFSWGPDDYILFGTAAGIQRVSRRREDRRSRSRGSRPAAGVAAHTWPSLMPDGRARTHHHRPQPTAPRPPARQHERTDRSVISAIRGHGFMYHATRLARIPARHDACSPRRSIPGIPHAWATRCL